MTVLTTQPAPNGRGCGTRQEQVPYACCGLGLGGLPIEEFIQDPGKAFAWQRFVKIVKRNPADPNSVNDLMIFVGSGSYPSPFDFWDEGGQFGTSWKLTKGFDFSALTPVSSARPDGTRMRYVHRHAIPLFEYVLNREQHHGPFAGCIEQHHFGQAKERMPNTPSHHSLGKIDGTPCMLAHTDLRILLPGDFEASPFEGFYTNKRPNSDRQCKYPRSVGGIEIEPRLEAWLDFKKSDEYKALKWESGIFLNLPLTTIEYKGKSDEQSKNNALAAGFPVAVLDH